MNTKIEKISEILKRKRGVMFAYLFGSQVKLKGKSGRRSDWDIAVYFTKKNVSEWDVFQLEAEISREIKEEVQIIILNKFHSPIFLFQIINGLLLVNKNKKERMLFESFVLRQYKDYGYFLKRQMAMSRKMAQENLIYK